MMRLFVTLSGLLSSGPLFAAIILSANGDPTGPITVEVNDAISIEVSASNCSNVGGGNSVWRDTWTNGGTPAQQIFASSPCADSPFGRTISFDTAGTYTVSFVSEYCRNFRSGNCRTGWVFDGRDEITVIVTDPLALTCFNDEFGDGSLNQSDWVTSVSTGNFTPGIADNGRLRMTEAVSNQATAATLQREIPGADNLVILEFDYFAYGGNGADGLAVVLSDALVTPQPGSYGGSLGYAQRNNGDDGFAGGWLGIGLDEFGNFSAATEGRIGGPGFRRDAVAIRGAGPDYRYLDGTPTLSPGIDQPNTSTPSPHRYRITVDSRGGDQALVSVERDLSGTGDDYQTLVSAFDALNEPGQPPVPENFLLSLTGSTGGSNNIHELDNVQLCALQLNPVGAQVDHFEIVHDGTALTCQPETVTIRACANADCSTLFTDPVDATMTPSGWVGGDTITITGGVTTTAMLRQTTAGEVELGVTGSQPSTRPQSVTLCQSGGSGLASTNCTLPFYDAGLVFDVPDRVANSPADTVEVRAVRQDDETQACEPAFENVTREVSFWSTFIDPGGTALSSTPPVSVSGAAVGQAAADATSLELTFDANGVATVEVAYLEAGQMQLDAVYTGSAATDDEGLVMPGNDMFVSSPAGFCIEVTAPEAACGDPWDQCSILGAAGDPFEVSLRAVAWESAGETGAAFCSGNATTTNFRTETPLTLSHELLAPVAGVPGDLAETEQSLAGSDAGAVEFNQTISEVGVFELLVAEGQLYFGQPLPGGASGPVGRLTPANFELDTTLTNPGALEASCTAGQPFSYSGQPMGWLNEPEVYINARNRAGGLTTNYTQPGFRKLTETGVSRIYPTTDDTAELADGSGLLPVVYAGNPATLTVHQPGVMRYRFSDTDTLTYTKQANARLEPFAPDLTFIISAIVDADNVSAAGAPYDLEPSSGLQIFFGRWVMENVYGPENIPSLAMPFRAEYWNGSRYVLNEEDSCSAWDTSAIGGTSDHHALAVETGNLAGGLGGPLSLEPAGSQGTDTLEWSVPLWLQGYGDSGTLDDPTGLATFGVYRGHDRVIYWRGN